MRIVVTGGGGFLGRAVIDRANFLGHDAWRFDRSDGNDILGDLSALHGADTVIHMAGMLGTHELFDTAPEAIESNVIGAVNILNFCKDYGIDFVGITMPDSSWANVYQATKLCAKRLATAWHREYGVGVSHVRAFNAYGPGQAHGPGHPQKILPTFAYHAWRGLPIPVWGDGEQSVDLVHSDDVARMLVDACAFKNDEVFDAGTGIELSVNSVARMVNMACDQPPDNIEYKPMRRGETPHTSIVAKGEGWDLLGWHPNFNSVYLHDAVQSYKP